MTNEVTVPELGRRMNAVERRLADDVVDARQFRAEMERVRESITYQTRETASLETKLDAIERDRKETEREQARALRNLFYSILLTLVTVLAGAILTVLRTGGI